MRIACFFSTDHSGGKLSRGSTARRAIDFTRMGSDVQSAPSPPWLRTPASSKIPRWSPSPIKKASLHNMDACSLDHGDVVDDSALSASNTFLQRRDVLSKTTTEDAQNNESNEPSPRRNSPLPSPQSESSPVLKSPQIKMHSTTQSLQARAKHEPEAFLTPQYPEHLPMRRSCSPGKCAKRMVPVHGYPSPVTSTTSSSCCSHTRYGCRTCAALSAADNVVIKEGAVQYKRARAVMLRYAPVCLHPK